MEAADWAFGFGLTCILLVIAGSMLGTYPAPNRFTHVTAIVFGFGAFFCALISIWTGAAA